MRKVLQIMILLLSVFVLVACGDKTPDLTIDAPKNVELNGDVLTWDAVSDADSYLVYIDTRSVAVTGTTFNLANEPMTVGEHLISVVAVRGEGFSIPSTVLTYTVASLADPVNIANSVIALVDETYEPDMDQSDFAYEWEYESYLEAMQMATAYAEATANLRMTEENAVGFFEDFSSMAQSLDETTTLNDVMDEMEMFDTYNMTPYATAYVIYNLALVGMTQDEVEQEILDAFEDNEEVVVQSLEMVLDFIMTVKDAIPANVISTIDTAIANEEITNAEIFLIKDEMLQILIDNLPSVSDFAILYTALFHVSGAITGVDMTSYISHATYLAEVNHLEFEIVLGLLDSITLQNMNEVEALVNAMQTETYDPYWDEYYMETDPAGAIELILYLVTFVDDYVAANQTLFDQMDALMADDSAEALFVIAIDNVIAQIQADVTIPTAEKTEIIALLNEFKGEYDTIVAAQAVIQEIGMSALREFIDSEASLILSIMELAYNDGTLTDTQIIAIVESIIDDAIAMNNAIMNELDVASIQALLDFVKIPVMIAINVAPEFSELPFDVEAIYDALSPDVAQLIANVVVLEKAIVSAASVLDVSTFPDLDGMSGPLTIALQVLDEALTPANEALILSSIDIVFDDILSQTEILSALGMTSGDLATFKSGIVTQVEFYIDEIQEMVTWDLENLTTTQQERLENMLMLLDEIFGSNGGNTQPVEAWGIVAGQEILVTVNDNEVVYYVFTPMTSGFYDIYSTTTDGSIDPVLEVLDMYMEYLDDDDDSGDGLNFYLNYYFEAYETYYFAIETYNYDTVSFFITLSYPNA